MEPWLLRDLLHGRTPGAVPAHAPPPHLTNAQWRFTCECGYRWHTPETAGRDAEWRDEAWRPPRAECLNCHAWIEGHPAASP
jgi:hypothetical protein